MSGNTFYVSGGQVDGKFMSDLWGFDLSTRQSRVEILLCGHWLMLAFNNDNNPA